MSILRGGFLQFFVSFSENLNFIEIIFPSSNTYLISPHTLHSYKAIWKFLRPSESLYNRRHNFLSFVQTHVCTFVGSLYKPYNPNVSKDRQRRPWKQVVRINESTYFIPRSKVLMLDCILVMTKKSSLMDIGQSVQISAGSWIVHMARPESQVERPKKKLPVARVFQPWKAYARPCDYEGSLGSHSVIFSDRRCITYHVG